MKISSIPPKFPAVDVVESSRELGESASASGVQGATGAAATDPIAQIAQDVAAGKIGQKEAVDRILADVLKSPMIEAVPESVRSGLEEALRNLIEEDPHLRSLCAAVAPGETE